MSDRPRTQLWKALAFFAVMPVGILVIGFIVVTPAPHQAADAGPSYPKVPLGQTYTFTTAGLDVTISEPDTDSLGRTYVVVTQENFSDRYPYSQESQDFLVNDKLVNVSTSPYLPLWPNRSSSFELDVDRAYPLSITFEPSNGLADSPVTWTNEIKNGP
jgi:hypothetical protein